MKSLIIAICTGLTFWISSIGLPVDQSESQKGIHVKVFDRFNINPQGLLHIYFTDGSDTVIHKEHGRYEKEQDSFEKIRFSEDRHLVGWLGSYMICTQSYPCSPELVIFDPEHGRRHVVAPHGIIWEWAFIGRGERVVIHYGFPHGDAAGAYAVYDSESGDKIAEYDATEIPEWVRKFQNEKIRSLNRQLEERGK